MKRYNSINDVLRSRFGERVYKVSLDSGLSCPNRDGTIGAEGCIFCNFESYRPATSVVSRQSIVDRVSIAKQLEDGILYIGGRHKVRKVISYFQGGSNTHAPARELAQIYNEAIDHPAVVGLAISTRPDCIGNEHLDLLESLSKRTMLWVELGLQSAHDRTLEFLGRGHTSAKFKDSCRRLRERGIPVCSHVILGLPGETRHMMLETAGFLNETGIWGIKIHNLHVLKGTKLELLYNEGTISLPSLDEYAALVVDFLEILNPDTVIHRVNSHSPRHLTVAPRWSINKLAIFNAVERLMLERNTRQGSKFQVCRGKDIED